MSRFAARCVIVGAAVALVVAGVLAPISGAGQSVLLGAGACCALVDVVLHRSALPDPGTRPAQVVAPRAPDQPVAADPLGSPAQPTGTTPEDDDGTAVVVLGHGPGGNLLRVDAGSHIVVVGAGALAVAVFRGLAEQLRAAAVHADDDLRWAVAPGLLDAAGSRSDDPAPTTSSAPSVETLPSGTSVAVWMGADGRPHGTVVLVPGLGAAPRHRDVTVEVSRYGCSVRRLDGHGVVRVFPALPVLAPDPVRADR
ncbi:hypothetical protein [Curtobacterium flaccumfaciens]|uniref:hypothetical protein n=1 Tax=Curtobacterium flaccumfaciens TaxID=2035 RepID=UPI001BDF4DED|nr:hypothetical protein [Curtobacterium flaccumfaciens]MBT1605720.1 hypothetical protein [Curtobacterium flaccumfaciens pv. betae]MBT1655418.1 hypothetical protein [Curtobacterium flaccumfaciens pv. betae]MCS0469501.1 hypothetical protein [Curtobacterium flaccumfaciens pv. betae]MCS0474544.1 hypothetical protein [Curtobacterium flaccumfaciens pv. betae]MCS0476349.1 hypothetical protein [Curtobacterium flaccumfaciens pv. betae]